MDDGAAAAEAATLTVKGIQHVNTRAESKECTLKINSNHGFVYKNKSEQAIALPLADIRTARWMKVARQQQLRLTKKDGFFETFEGIKSSVKKEINEYAKKYAFPFETTEQETSCVGWNWGDAKIEKGNLTYQIKDKGKDTGAFFTAFELPLALIQKAEKSATGRDVTLYMQTKAAKDDDSRTQQLETMQFHFTDIKTAKPDTEEGEDDEDETPDKATQFLDDVLAKASIQQLSDELIALEGIMCLNLSRAKYDVTFYPDLVLFRGKQKSHRIKYSNIKRLFFLPRPDTAKRFFVLALDDPLRVTNTKRESMIVMELDENDECPAGLKLEKDGLEDEAVKEKLADVDEDQGGKAVPLLLGELFKTLTGHKIYKESGQYATIHENKGLKCIYEAAKEGYLFPLEKSFLFIHQPTLWIQFKDCESVAISRDEHSASQSFDLLVDDGEKEHTFRSIPKRESDNLFGYLQFKKLNVKKSKVQQSRMADDFGEEGEDDGYDPHMAASKMEGADNDDDSDSDDEDFDGGQSSNGSADDDEFSDGAAGAEKGEKKEKKLKKKRAGGDDDDDGAHKPKKAKKKVRDPDEPKRPQGAFFLYLNALRPMFKEDNPDMSHKEITAEISKNWNDLSSEEKEPFESEAAELKKAYVVKKAEWDLKNGKTAKDPKAPKRPLSSYMIFSQENREKIMTENPGIKFTEVAKKAGEMWKSITAEEKKPYEEKAVAAKAKYEIEIKEYYEKNPEALEKLKAAKSSKPKKARAPSAGGGAKKQTKIVFKSAELIEDSDEE